jgi:Histidine kinase
MHLDRRTTARIGQRLAALLFCLLVAASAHADWRVHAGHDPRWIAPQFDDSSWRAVPGIEKIRDTGEVTIRVEIDLSKRKPIAGHPTALYVGGMFSHEVWWDGILLGRGGVVGRTKAEEVPGPIEAHYHIPDRLAAPGKHTLVMRTSAFHRGFSPLHGYWAAFAGDYDRIVVLRKANSNRALIALSGIVMTAVFALALFFLTGRNLPFLLLGALCIAAGGLLMVESSRELFGYTYDWHIVRMRSVVAMSWVVGQLLVALLVTRFPHRRSRLVLASTAILSIAPVMFIRGWDPKAGYIFLVCILASLGWTIFAATRRMHGSVLALVGVAGTTLALFIQPTKFVDNVAYFAFDFLFVCLLCSHALEVRRTQQEKSRLQLEMLRRHMQPHFLMNTLTAIAEWIEQEPKTAVRLIDSLADELRILGEMTNRRVVSAEDELRLCRSHLANMSLRKDVAYELEVEGVDGDRPVPPAVFHTLVENAITHGSASDGHLTMRLSGHADRHRMRYVFESPAGAESESGNGTGTRYIEARLREAWGDAWSFRQGRVGAMWRAEIEVPA